MSNNNVIDPEELKRRIEEQFSKSLSGQYAYVGTLLGTRAWKKAHGFPFNPNWVNGDLIPVHPKHGVVY